MSTPEYSEEELKKMRIFERAMWLRDIEVGKPVTDRQMEAINFFLGDMIAQVKAMKPTVATIKFTDKGDPYTTDGNPLGISIDGKRPTDLNDGGRDEVEGD